MPSVGELAASTLAQQHPASRGWQLSAQREALLAEEHGLDLQLATDMGLAARRRDRFAPDLPASALLNRWVRVRPGLTVMLSARYEGGDPALPFVDVSATTLAITQRADVQAVAAVAAATFGVLRPRYLRWWTATRCDLAGVGTDKRFLAAPVRTLADRVRTSPSELALRLVSTIDHYGAAVAAYAAVDRAHPQHRRQAAVESLDDLTALARAGGVFEVVVAGGWAGYLAVEAGHKLGLSGYKVAELVMDPAARGHGYGPHLHALLSQELGDRPGPEAVLIGTVHPGNRGALRAATRAGRLDIGGWNTVSLIARAQTSG